MTKPKKSRDQVALDLFHEILALAKVHAKVLKDNKGKTKQRFMLNGHEWSYKDLRDFCVNVEDFIRCLKVLRDDSKHALKIMGVK